MGGFANIASTIVRGAARASGQNDVVSDIDRWKQDKRSDALSKQKEALAPLTQALQSSRTRLALYADPSDPTKAVQGKEAEYAAAHDQVADVIGKMRLIMHPPPPDDPHGLKYLGEKALDKLHITRDLANHAREEQAAKVADYQQGTRQDVQSAVQGTDLLELQPKLAQIDNDPNLSPEQKNDARAKLYGIPGPKPQYDIITGTIDGQRVSFQRNKTDAGDVRDLAGGNVSPEILSRFVPDPKVPPKAPKGLKFDPATGQVVDGDTGKRYSQGDPGNPPEVQAAFRGSDAMQKKKEAFAIKLAGMRGASYNATRPINSLDTQNGNAPVEVPFVEYQKNPGRYVPAGEADKAIAKENLMQDIAGTSALTRKAIAGMKQDFPEDAKVKIALAMKADDPHAALDQLIASGALGSLTGDQQDFLIATRQLAENAMAMRTVLGAGQGSDDMRAAIRATLPSLLSPDKSYANRQLDAFDATIRRLHRGVPKISLNETPMTPPPGSKGSRSLGMAMHLPINKGKSAAEVEQDLTRRGYSVTRP